VRSCSISKGVSFQRIMNAMGYTLAVVGNSVSLPYGPQALTPLAARADFPILAANLRDGDGPLVEGVRSHVVIPLPGGLRMGVIGLTAPWGNMYEWFGLHLPDFVAVARGLVDALRGEGVSPIALLSHLGLDDDRRVAQAVPEIDLIVGGHSHSLLPEGEIENGVLMAQAGEHAQALGRVDLTLHPETGAVLERSAQVLPVPDDEPPDPLVLEAIKAADRETEELLARPVGTLQEALSLDHFDECGIGNLAADALRERMDAEAALVASGMFHQGLPAGVVTLGQLDRASFSSANPAVTRVRGSQILAALERGLDPAISQPKHKGFRGTPMGIPQISGMVVEYDADAEVGQRVRHVLVQGEPLDLERVYRVAHTDAEIIPEFGYLLLGEGQEPRYEVPTILREAMEAYIQGHSPVPPPESGRWVRV
jgi:2',3'-cyclic-nucleotide 2'-phosphodiesterase (5'-nucleotidase family)